MKIVNDPIDITRAQRIFLSAYLEDLASRKKDKEEEKKADKVSGEIDSFVNFVKKYGRRTR